MKVGEQLREIWRQATGRAGGRQVAAAGEETERRTLALPAVLGPVQFPGAAAAQGDAGEPAAVCGDAGGAPGHQCHQGPDCGDGLAGARAARSENGGRRLRGKKAAGTARTLEEPNGVDSFRTLIEQAIEDALTGGYGAIEMEPTGGWRPAGDVMGGGWRIDPDQRAVGRAGGDGAVCTGAAGADGVEARLICATTS